MADEPHYTAAAMRFGKKKQKRQKFQKEFNATDLQYFTEDMLDDLTIFIEKKVMVKQSQKYKKNENSEKFQKDLNDTDLQYFTKDMLNDLPTQFVSAKKKQKNKRKKNKHHGKKFQKELNCTDIEYAMVQTYVHSQYCDGRTALHCAVEYDDIIQVYELLAHGAYVNIEDHNSETPLHIAAYNNYHYGRPLVTTVILLKNGADINSQNKYGTAPLGYLAKKANFEQFQFFLKFKANINISNEYGPNLMFLVAGCNQDVKVLQLLIDLGLNVNSLDENNQTPLFKACNIEIDNYKIVKCLLRNGANMNLVDYYEETPLSWAIKMVKYESNYYSLEQKKKFHIMLECYDFDSYLGNDILDYCNENSEYLWKTILQHVAKLQMFNIPVHPRFLSTVQSRKEYSDYFKECKKELIEAKNTKLPNSWITFNNLLTDNKKKLKNYGGNKDLIKDFEKSDYVEKFPIYGSTMSENFKKGIMRRELFDKASIVLSGCLPVFNRNHLIIRDLLDCDFSKNKLKKLCDEN